MANIDNEQQEFEKLCKAICADNVWTVKEALKRFEHIEISEDLISQEQSNWVMDKVKNKNFKKILSCFDILKGNNTDS